MNSWRSVRGSDGTVALHFSGALLGIQRGHHVGNHQQPQGQTMKAKAKTMKQALEDTTSSKKDKGPQCPKCQHTGWTGPRYRPAQTLSVLQVSGRDIATFRRVQTFAEERLEYVCNTCGYTRHEACSSQKA